MNNKQKQRTCPNCKGRGFVPERVLRGRQTKCSVCIGRGKIPYRRPSWVAWIIIVPIAYVVVTQVLIPMLNNP